MADNTMIVQEKYRYSCMRIKEYQYTWIYKIPSEVLHVGKRNDSPDFFTGENNEYKWNIEMFFGGYNSISKDYVGMRIYTYNASKIKNDSNFKAMIKLSILDKNNKHRMEQSAIVMNHNVEEIQFQTFMKRDRLLNSPDLQLNNEIKFICRILFDVGVNQVSHLKTPWSAMRCRNIQMSNYEKMFDNPELSDFEFIIGNTRIKVHKCILAAHSTVFAAMFQSDMIETNKNEVNIEDAEANVMRQLLRFVYVGEVQDIDDFADKLFIAADKYQLNELKDVCEEKLIEKLTIDSLYETLLFVDKYDTNILKDAAIEFIICNSKKLPPIEEFQKSIKNLSSLLLAQIICAFVERSE